MKDSSLNARHLKTKESKSPLKGNSTVRLQDRQDSRLSRTSSVVQKSTNEASNLASQIDGLTNEDTSYYSEVFYMFDSDKSGAIDMKELSAAVRSTGMEPSDAQLRVMMAGVSGTDKEEVSLQEFLRMVAIIKTQNTSHKEKQLELEEAFGFMDLDGNGVITASDMFKVLENIGERIPADQIYEMLEYGDTDFDGKVTLADFIKIMTS